MATQKNFLYHPFLKKELNYSLIEVFIPVGSAYEEKEIAGISHLLEHLVGLRIKNLSSEFTKLGVYVNANTEYYFTRFYFSVLNANVKKTLNLLEKLFFEADFSQEDLEKEKKLIKEEMFLKSREDLSYEKFFASIFKNTNLANPIIGYPSTIQNISLSLLKNWYKKFYTKPILISWGTEKFNSSFKGKIDLRPPRIKMTSQSFIKIIKDDKESKNILLKALILENNYDWKKRVLLELFAAILSSTEISLLYQNIINPGLSYRCYSYCYHYNGLSLLLIYGESKQIKKVDEILENILLNFNQLITPELFHLIKSYYLNQYLLEEANGEIIYYLGREYCTFGCPFPFKDVLSFAEKIRYQDFMEFIQLILNKGIYKLMFI